MTMQTEQLIGTQVTGGDGQVVGTVRQIFNDDSDGRPVWARVRAGTQERFVPLGGSRVTKDGLSVPFDAKRIMGGPDVGAERHLTEAETAQLNRYFDLTVPAQAGPPDVSARDGEAWLICAEERADVGTELRESGRVRLRKYVDVEPVEQTVRVFHEEYEVERVPLTPEEQARGVIADGEQGEREVILHEERPVVRKEAVPVERVRLVVKKVGEDRILRDEIRRERVEIETDDGRRGPAAQAEK